MQETVIVKLHIIGGKAVEFFDFSRKLISFF